MNTNSLSFRLRIYRIKASNWEYLPMWLVYLPVLVYYCWLAIRAKSFFFFSATNPKIPTGGMFFESKWDIFKSIPTQYYPNTILIDENTAQNVIHEKMATAQIVYPCIAKPDRGERGWEVCIVRTDAELLAYHTQINNAYLLQSLVEYPLEYSVFYCRYPLEKKGKVTGLTRKALLAVMGDGVSSILQLIMQHDRAFLQLKTLLQNTEIPLEKILQKDEKYTLVPFGNHVRGAMFIDDSAAINDELSDTFDRISQQIDGFYFGRYDVKCTSEADLIAGKNIMIVELNGAGAEPSHIYDPNFPFLRAQKVLFQHYKMMYVVAQQNHQKGVAYMSLKAVRETLNAEKMYKAKAKNS